MAYHGDVFEFLIDGISGLAPGGVEGSCLVVGVCSKGQVGKGYLLGKQSDLNNILGVGPLTDRLNDMFATGGQAPYITAVPVQGLEGGYIATVEKSGTGPDATSSGVPGANADVLLEIVTGGALGVAEYKLSEDGGSTYGADTLTPADGQVAIGATGVTLVLGSGSDQVVGDIFEFAIRDSIGPVTKIGTGPDITAAGTVARAAQVKTRITGAGGRNVGLYQTSLDGGDAWGPEKTIPVDGLVVLDDTGVTITVPVGDMVLGDTYAFDLLPPVPSISAVMDALETPLNLFDVEFIYVVGASDSPDWAAMGALADELWNKHRPTFIKSEARLPYASETVDEWVAALVAERQTYAHRFVQCCATYGEISDSHGRRLTRNAAGLQAGRSMKIPVQRATGRVRDGGISQLTLPDNINEAHQRALENAGYLTAGRYAMLRSCFWKDSKTFAEVTSDFQYEEVLRVTFKALRLMRVAALKSMYDEAGDPVAEGGASGLKYLQVNIENALDTMVGAVPQELAGCQVTIPPNQDIANNGVSVVTLLIGIPIIRSIKLYTGYVYAGGKFDPRINKVEIGAV